MEVKNIDSLFSSSVQQQHKPEKTTDVKEKMHVEVTSNVNGIDQSKLRQSNPVTSSAVSPYKQVERSNVSEVQVKQSNSYSGATINRNGFSVQQTTLEKIKHMKELLKDYSSFKSPYKTVKKGNKVNCKYDLCSSYNVSKHRNCLRKHLLR